MTLLQVFVILRARMRLLLKAMLATVFAALLISLLFPNIYKAGTSLVLNYKGIDPVSGTAMAPQLMPGYMATQIDVIKSKNVALRVVDALRLADRPSFQEDYRSDTGGRGDIRDWIAERLLEKVKVVPGRDSSVIDIIYRSRDADFAADVANAFATQYLETLVQLTTDPLKGVSSYFTSQISVLREALEAAQNKLSAYQQEAGIVDADSQMDVETMRLNDLSSQLVQVQGQLQEARSRQRQAAARGGENSPEVIANPLIQNLKTQLAQADAKLAQLSGRLEPAHPAYEGAQLEADKLRAELQRHVRASLDSLAINSRVIEQRERDLKAAVEAQKARVLELGRARDRLTLLAKDAGSARDAYDAAVARFNKVNLEGHANQPDVTVLNPSTPPIDPWFPRLGLNMMLAPLIGLMIGIALALALEWMRPRLRTLDDLGMVLDGVVIDEIDWTPQRPPRRLLPAIASRPALR
ncbi:chain length determinant protein EpsF [Noviherbaspirillum humi]|uniref:Chain length determinant protein EpsF n=1 Tax=Noviherbaspirillum humi TaxID=1688639 RepID=A0A239C4N0_9BURK|nr:chain length determinant protein EpsF [Noviherbaspirillum humi]SNS14601.1 chain length determinant protein EpsF [Noviherbaspirillum humi]